jgi:PAS domain-containing protein
MSIQIQSVPFAEGDLGAQRHICAFFNSADEEHRVLRSFLKDGLTRGDKAFHLVNPELREEHLKRLAEAGINVQEAIDSGQLEVRSWQDAPLRGGQFDQDTWLVSFEQVLQSGPAAGYAQTRFLAHMAQRTADLRRSEAHLAEAQKASHTGSFGWSVSTGQIYWSEETFRIFEYHQANKPTVEFVLQRTHPEDKSFVRETLDHAARDRKAFDFEHRLLMSDG